MHHLTGYVHHLVYQIAVSDWPGILDRLLVVTVLLKMDGAELLLNEFLDKDAQNAYLVSSSRRL